MNALLAHDPELADIIQREEERQQDGITLIASENYAYPEIYARFVGSVLANKYAEGYPYKRYYAGCSL